MPLMSEDLDDFPAENSSAKAESMVVAFRAQSTDEWAAPNGITSKKTTLCWVNLLIQV